MSDSWECPDTDDWTSCGCCTGGQCEECRHCEVCGRCITCAHPDELGCCPPCECNKRVLSLTTPDRCDIVVSMTNNTVIKSKDIRLSGGRILCGPRRVQVGFYTRTLIATYPDGHRHMVWQAKMTAPALTDVPTMSADSAHGIRVAIIAALNNHFR